MIDTHRAMRHAVLGGLILAGSFCPAQVKEAAPTLQQRVDALEQGQGRILEELKVLEAMLKERPASPSAPVVPNAGGRLSVNVFGEPFKGTAGARIAILEYSDFDCFYCGKYSTGVFPRIDADYVRTGKVKYFFRDLPLPAHPNAPYKAQVARCAGDQGKFWEAHDWLFAHRQTLDPAGLTQLILDLRLDPGPFQAELASAKYAEAIRMSSRSAEHLQIRGTPAFLIGTLSPDGRVLTVTKVLLGAESYESFKGTLDELLGASATASAAGPIRPGGASCG